MNRQPGLAVRLHEDRCTTDYRSPSTIARLLVGRPVGDAPAMLSTLFAICPSAQRLACEVALGAAQGESMDAEAMEKALRAVRLESIREHGLRILLAWPATMGEEPDRDSAAKLNCWSRGGGAHRLRGLLAASVFGGSVTTWLRMAEPAEVAEWADSGVTAAARFLARACHAAGPLVPPQSLLARHRDLPLFAGERWRGLAAHHLARLVDLALLVENIDAVSTACPLPLAETGAEAGMGGARVASSRGELRHRVCVEKGRITAYEIISPTDIAFGMGGYGRDWVGQAAPRGRAAVRAVLDGLDPCVDSRVEVM